MSGRPRRLTDDELGQALARAFPATAWPPTPEIVPAVAEALGGARRRPIPARLPMDRRRRRILLIAAALLALAAVAAATKLVIDLGAIAIETIPGRPTAVGAGPDPGAFGAPVDLGSAAATAGFEPLVPASLGPPDRVWVDRGPVSYEAEGSRIVLAWRPRPDLPRIPGSDWGAVLMQFRGTADVAFKFVYEDTGRLDEAFVDGRTAYWTTGRHRLDLLTDEGVVTLDVRGHVLLWDEGDVAMRLETLLPHDRATEIAESA
jgi:hypothetical protein